MADGGGANVAAGKGVGDGLGANVGAGMGVANGVDMGGGGNVGTGVAVIVSSTRVHAANSGPSTTAERPRAVAPRINWRRVTLGLGPTGCPGDRVDCFS